MFKNKILLITGGTGSFGNAVLKKFINTDIGEIRIFSRDEKKQDDMRITLNNDKVKYYIGDVRDFNSINHATRGVDYIFSAAALKQVPSCEFYPLEAVKTNILGTQNVLNAAVQNGVKKVIVLSTDKAVYPINAMGMSKALMEKVVVATSRNVQKDQTIMCSTRYGNVMGSRGSVIPLFIKQIKEGKPLTLTDPHMTRFMMYLDEAVDLVLYAFNNGEQGDLFVQKSPAATMEDLAVVLKKIFNGTNEIVIIGTRHGEKKHETLLNREEFVYAEDLGRYYRVRPDSRDLNYKEYFSQGEQIISSKEDYTSCNTYRLNQKELEDVLLKLDVIQEELRM